MGTTQKKTILIVDDMPENIDILRGLLADQFSIKAATNGETALKIAGTMPPPDMILLDILMPGTDGYQVCKTLKANAKTKSIPVIFLTSKNEINDKTEAIDAGAADYITKPYDADYIKQIIMKHIRR